MEVLPCAGKEIDWNPALIHRVETLDLIRRPLSEQDAQNAASEREKYQKEYEALLRDLEAHPEKREENRWYVNITRAYRRMKREDNVMRRLEEQQTQPTLPFEVHVLRLGDIAFATNPFELYLDYGMQIKGRSKATQTFLVQLAGPGSYLPTPRSIAGGAYGAVPSDAGTGRAVAVVWPFSRAGWLSNHSSTFAPVGEPADAPASEPAGAPAATP
mgnify:CR=1 FL=1